MWFSQYRWEGQSCETLGCQIREGALLIVSVNLSVDVHSFICLFVFIDTYSCHAVMATKILCFVLNGIKTATGC